LYKLLKKADSFH
jgi:hypothetical protein